MTTFSKPELIEGDQPDLQSERLVEILEYGEMRIRLLLHHIRAQTNLAKLDSHFRKHGFDFSTLGVKDTGAFQDQLKKHLANDSLRIYTYITTKATSDRMWILVDVDTGITAQYNETKGRMWSFYAQPGFARYAEEARGWWVEVTVTADEVRVEPWK